MGLRGRARFTRRNISLEEADSREPALSRAAAIDMPSIHAYNQPCENGHRMFTL